MMCRRLDSPLTGDGKVGGMSASVTIGEFSRLTHLTVKSLRHYHDQGLLTPHAIDPQSGYRRYAVDQAPAAMLIGRLRALDMPLAEVRRVLESADPGERDAVIAEHLLRMERELDRTRAVVASLRDLLSPATTLAVHGRTLAELSVVAITEHVARADIGAWCDRTFTALYTDLLTAGGQPTGPGGALYGEEFFTEAAGLGHRVRPGRPRPGDRHHPRRASLRGRTRRAVH